MSGDMEESQMAEETPVEEKVTLPRINGSSSNRSAVDFVAASLAFVARTVLVIIDVLSKK